jgi:hypothetical protein
VLILPRWIHIVRNRQVSVGVQQSRCASNKDSALESLLELFKQPGLRHVFSGEASLESVLGILPKASEVKVTVLIAVTEQDRINQIKQSLTDSGVEVVDRRGQDLVVRMDEEFLFVRANSLTYVKLAGDELQRQLFLGIGLYRVLMPGYTEFTSEFWE